ncbi:MAG: hypothetical protein HQL54_02735 [Magnetococcales bacterium]|nr:hypothetical protein [Magnetococcales bacterium]
MLSYETDGMGTALQGSYEALLEQITNGSDLSVGLGARVQVAGRSSDILPNVENLHLNLAVEEDVYEEIIPLPSTIITKDNIIGVQPFHTASPAAINAQRYTFASEPGVQAHPYSSILIYAADRGFGSLRSHFPGSDRTISSMLPKFDPEQKTPYHYYRWFTDDRPWRCVYQSGEDGLDEREHLLSLLEGNRDVKVSFEFNGATYFLHRTILYFGHPDRSDISIRTFPTLMPIGKGFDNYGALAVVEFTVRVDGQMSMLRYRLFNTEGRLSTNVVTNELTAKVKWWIR